MVLHLIDHHGNYLTCKMLMLDTTYMFKHMVELVVSLINKSMNSYCKLQYYIYKFNVKLKKTKGHHRENGL